jgi:hypothetical protein
MGIRMTGRTNAVTMDDIALLEANDEDITARTTAGLQQKGG